MNLIQAVNRAAALNPAAPAFVFNGQVTSYQKFLGTLRLVSAALYERGVRPGDVVGLFMGYDPLHCIAILALARLGAVSVPLHPAWPQPRRISIVAKYRIGAVVSFKGDHGIAGVKNILLDGVISGAAEATTDCTDYAPDPTTPCRISLSSGTTGEPKGEVLTHGYLLDRIGKTLYSCDRNSRIMPFDLNHPMGMTLAIGALTTGSTLVFAKSYRTQEMMEAINLYAVSHAFLPPATAASMASMQAEGGIAFPGLAHLRLVGGAPSAALLDDIRNKLTPNVFVSYGLTELGPIAVATPEILAAWPRSVGKVMPWVQIEILDEAGQLLPPDASGEIRLRVDGIPTEYYGDEAATAQKFRDGWFYTGDIGRLSGDGLLFIDGRKDDVINLGGPKVNLAWVEEMLATHPHVAEAATFAVSDASGAASLAAAILPRIPEINIEEVARFAKQQIGAASPTQFIVMREFPRNPSGKVVRNEVAAKALKIWNDKLAEKKP
jgi:fatty-acyl-CoA synthase/O-succinylbenzoic acid--CoA ligase